MEPEAFARETREYRSAEKGRCPRLFCVDQDLSLIVIEYERCAVTLADVLSHGTSPMPWLPDLASLLARLHLESRRESVSRFNSVLPTLDPVDHGFLMRSTSAVQEAIRRIQADLDLLHLYEQARASTGSAPIHGDVTPDNVLVTSSGVSLVDWELSGRGPPAHDVGCVVSCLLLWGLQLTDGRSERSEVHSPRPVGPLIDQFLQSYRATAGDALVLRPADVHVSTVGLVVSRALVWAALEAELSDNTLSAVRLASRLTANPESLMRAVA